MPDERPDVKDVLLGGRGADVVNDEGGSRGGATVADETDVVRVPIVVERPNDEVARREGVVPGREARRVRVEPNGERPHPPVIDVRVRARDEARIRPRSREDVLVDERLEIDPGDPERADDHVGADPARRVATSPFGYGMRA